MRTNLRIVLVLASASVFSHAQWLNYPTRGIPRTPDGKPNLSAPAPQKDGKPVVILPAFRKGSLTGQGCRISSATRVDLTSDGRHCGEQNVTLFHKVLRCNA